MSIYRETERERELHTNARRRRLDTLSQCSHVSFDSWREERVSPQVMPFFGMRSITRR